MVRGSTHLRGLADFTHPVHSTANGHLLIALGEHVARKGTGHRSAHADGPREVPSLTSTPLCAKFRLYVLSITSSDETANIAVMHCFP